MDFAKELDRDNFRLQAKKLMLVYEYHRIGNFELEASLEAVFNNYNVEVDTITIAVEETRFTDEEIEEHDIDISLLTMEEDGSHILHNTYAVILLQDKPQIKSAAEFTYVDEELEIPARVFSIPTVANYKKALAHLKSFTNDGDEQKPPPNLFRQVSACKTLAEALEKYCVTPNYAAGIKMLWEAGRGKNTARRFNYEPTFSWQQDFLREFDSENGAVPDSRRIVWVFDAKGNSGKTGISKWLGVYRPNEWLCCGDLGTTRDAATYIVNQLESGWLAHGITINLSRSTENHERVYAYLEMIKDGSVTSQKYQGQSRIFDNPFVIVMSNFLPHIHCLSKDRWDVREITPTKEMVRLSVKDVYARQAVLVAKQEKRSQKKELLLHDALEGSFSSHASTVDGIARAMGRGINPTLQ